MCTLHNIRNIKNIWHFAYMVHICQYYMGNICQMTYILLILRIYMCIYVCIDVTSISDIYGIWHIRCIYVSTMCDIYIYQMAYKLLILCAYMCMYACLYVPNIGNTYDIWHIRCIYVSDIGSIYVNSHICYLCCTLIERNINYIYDIWHIRHICSIYGVYVPLGGAIFAYIKL